MEYYGAKMVVDAGELIGTGIVSKSNFYQLASRGHFSVVKRADGDRPAFVEYENMPDRFKKAVKTRIGNPYSVVTRNIVEEQIADRQDYFAFFADYRLPDGRTLTPEKQREYYANAIVLEAIGKIITQKV